MVEPRDKFFIEVVSICHEYFSALKDVCEKYYPNYTNGKLTGKSLKSPDEKEPTEKKKKIKKIIDPNAPKKPTTSPWILFYKDRREPLKKEYPDYDLKDITKVASKEWHNLPEDKKKPYLEKVRKNLSDYKEKMVEYTKNGKDPVILNKGSQNNPTPQKKNNGSNNNVLASSDEEKIQSKLVEKKEVESDEEEDDDDDDDDDEGSDNNNNNNNVSSEDASNKKGKKVSDESDSDESQSDESDIEPVPIKKIKRN